MLYYRIKPLIPRRLQIFIRRRIVAHKLKEYHHIWPIDPSAAKPPCGWRGWPGNKKFALVITHDVDTQKGHNCSEQLMRLEEKLGFRSSFNFVFERYRLSRSLIENLLQEGFEVGGHGLKHDGKLFSDKKTFRKRAGQINQYLSEYKAVGFRSPAMHHKLDWLHDLNMEYDSSTFDTDPFEPQPDAVGTIFPFWVPKNSNADGYIELPYTLPQDFTLFILMQKKNIDTWKRKLAWIAAKGGMALFITHPDYMNFGRTKNGPEEYPVEYFTEFLLHIKRKYHNEYWNALPREVASFYKARIPGKF